MKNLLLSRYSALIPLAAALLCPILVYGQFGQTVTDAITVTAQQSLTSQPNEAVYLVTVNSPINASLTNVAAQLSSVGITASNLTNVNSTVVANSTTGPALVWSFQLTVPIASQKATAAALAALESSMAQNNSGSTLSFTLTGAQSGGPSLQSCNLPGLMSNARAQAQSLAAAAGQTLGSIIGLTTSNVSLAVCQITVKFGLGYTYSGTGPNLISISLQQTTGPQVDQAVVALGVVSPLTSGLDDVTSALQGVGITGANFVGLSTTSNLATTTPQTVLGWTFELTTPIANIGSLMQQLLAAEEALQNANSVYSLAFAAAGAYSSQPLSCSQSSLLTTAQNDAQQLAGAAGVNAGSVLTLTAGSSVPAAPDVSYLGDLLWSAATMVASNPTTSSGTTTTTGTTTFGTVSGVAAAILPLTTCNMTAQFQLL